MNVINEVTRPSPESPSEIEEGILTSEGGPTSTEGFHVVDERDGVEQQLEWVFPAESILARYHFPEELVECLRNTQQALRERLLKRDALLGRSNGGDGDVEKEKQQSTSPTEEESKRIPVLVVPCRGTTSDIVFGSDGRFKSGTQDSLIGCSDVIVLFVPSDNESRERLTDRSYLEVLPSIQNLPKSWTYLCMGLTELRAEAMHRPQRFDDGAPAEPPTFLFERDGLVSYCVYALSRAAYQLYNCVPGALTTVVSYCCSFGNW